MMTVAPHRVVALATDNSLFCRTGSLDADIVRSRLPVEPVFSVPLLPKPLVQRTVRSGDRWRRRGHSYSSETRFRHAVRAFWGSEHYRVRLARDSVIFGYHARSESSERLSAGKGFSHSFGGQSAWRRTQTSSVRWESMAIAGDRRVPLSPVGATMDVIAAAASIAAAWSPVSSKIAAVCCAAICAVSFEVMLQDDKTTPPLRKTRHSTLLNAPRRQT